MTCNSLKLAALTLYVILNLFPCIFLQGQELEALRAATPYQHIVFCGDGANDLCPALALGPTDVVLARKVGLNEICNVIIINISIIVSIVSLPYTCS